MVLAVQPVTRTLQGLVGVDAVCTVMLSDLDDIMNVLLQRSFAVTTHQLSVWCFLPHHYIITTVAVWCSGSTLVTINVVILHRARLVLGWVRTPFAPFRF